MCLSSPRSIFSQIPQYLDEHKKLLAEYADWERKHQSEQEALAAEESRQAELNRKDAELKRKSAEPKRKSAEAGRQKEERLEAAKRRRKGIELPDEKDVWEFLEGEKGWEYTGSGWKVKGPEEGSKPMETCEVS